MLEEYFSIEIDEEGNLRTVPLVLPGYTPNLDHLPYLLLRMSFKVRYYESVGNSADLRLSGQLVGRTAVLSRHL